MGYLFGNLLVGATCALSACATPESRFAAQEERCREEMVARYRPGSGWREPQDKLGSFKLWEFASPAPDGFSDLALARARRQSADVRSCWWGFVARQGLGGSFGFVGSFVDYVFLDSDDRVIVAYRRFFD